MQSVAYSDRSFIFGASNSIFLPQLFAGMLLLGIDLGTSSVKVSVVDSATQQSLVVVQYPQEEATITSLKPGWAEQSPDTWWAHTQEAIRLANASGKYQPGDIAAIGIAYQMHGLVVVDKEQRVLRDAIIWCDSRAIPFGNKAFEALGATYCLSNLLNSPGNFTAAKLAWVRQEEPELYNRIDKIMLPGDFIAMKLTGDITTSISALSEGIFWDFRHNRVSTELMQFFGFDHSLIPAKKQVFTAHGYVNKTIASALGLKAGVPVTYKAGDQPNNALSLNVLEPGEVAATAGTSGVIYGVSDQLAYDPLSRVNTFAHVNYTDEQLRLGVLLCINGTGILNRWMKTNFSVADYAEMNRLAASIPPGSEGVQVLPFGNGAERILENKIAGAQLLNIDLNLHTQAHLLRAGQEGIAFAFRYGLDIMRNTGIQPAVIRAGHTNMFLSKVFTGAFVNATNVPVELFDCDGSMGAALGAGIGAGLFASEKEAFSNARPRQLVTPDQPALYDELYGQWKQQLEKQLA